MKAFYSSESLFHCREPLFNPEISRFRSIRGRLKIFKNFLVRLFLIPVALVIKIYHTIVSVMGLGLSILRLVATFCSTKSARAYFVKRVTLLAKDLADWILWPVAVIYCLIKLLLAASIHPSIYYRC